MIFFSEKLNIRFETVDLGERGNHFDQCQWRDLKDFFSGGVILPSFRV